MIHRIQSTATPGTTAASAGPTTPASRAGRMEWLDVAKGLCILLVVLHHVTSKYVMEILPADLLWVGESWKEINSSLKPMRMPVFFVISGFFAAGAIQRPWRHVRRRMTSPYYLFVVWSLVYVVVYRLETQMEANRTTGVVEFVGELVWASTSTWFLFALAVYFLVAKLLKDLPHLPVIAMAFALAVSTGWLGIEEVNRVSVLAHLGYFLVGAYLPQVVRWAGELSGQVVSGLATSYVAVFVLGGIAGLPSASLLPVASVVGVPLGLALARRLGDVESVARPLAWIGRRTLRVYVLHLAIVAAIFHLPFAVGDSGMSGAMFAGVLPIAVTAVVTGLCLAAHECIRRAGGSWLFALPGRWSGGAAQTETSAEGGEFVMTRRPVEVWSANAASTLITRRNIAN